MKLRLMPEHGVGSCLWIVENGVAFDPWDPRGKLSPQLVLDLERFNLRWAHYADTGWDRSRRESIESEGLDLARRVSEALSAIESVEVVVP